MGKRKKDYDDSMTDDDQRFIDSIMFPDSDDPDFNDEDDGYGQFMG